MINNDPFQQASLARAMQMASNASSLSRPPTYGTPPVFDIASLITRLAAQQQSPQVNQAGNQATGGGFNAFRQAIKQQESGGNYGAVNADSGAAGAYQIMPGNFVGPGGWDMDTIGRDVNLQAFLNHPRMQNRIAGGKLRDLFNQHGAAGAASAWYSGDPSLWNNRDSQGNYPSIHDYVLEILQRMGRR